MCLQIENPIADCVPPAKSIRVWKWYEGGQSLRPCQLPLAADEYVSPFRYNRQVITKGKLLVSGRKKRALTKEERSEKAVSEGFHAFQSLETLKWCASAWSGPHYAVEISVRPRDVVAKGIFLSKDKEPSIVFKRGVVMSIQRI